MVKRTNKERRNNLRNPLRRAIKKTQDGKHMHAATGQRNTFSSTQQGNQQLNSSKEEKKVHTIKIFEKSGK